jgi:acyl-CoA synthetase (NDP forming)
MQDVYSKLDDLLHPRSIAIVGASPRLTSAGYLYTSALIEAGYKGKIYPVNPKYGEILGLKSYPSLVEIPDQNVDFVVSVVRAERVPELIEECHVKKVKLIHLYTARMKETGIKERVELENQIVKKAKEYGIRVLGPNCMGVYYPKMGISWENDLPKEAGTVGGLLQSGGLSCELIRYASLRGIRFSKIINYGNASDIDESDLLAYFANDPETNVIVAYIEGVKDGKKFINALSYAAENKPVIVLKGGKGEAGKTAALSHTGSMAGSSAVWSAVLKQCRAIEVASLDELIDLVTAFNFLPPITGEKVLIAGGSGGTSVVSADIWEKEGFKLPEIPDQLRGELRKNVPELSDWIRNPIDRSIFQTQRMEKITPWQAFLKASEIGNFDLLVAELVQSDPWPDDVWKQYLDDFLYNVLKVKENKGNLIAIIEIQGFIDMERLRWRLAAQAVKTLSQNGVAVFYTDSGAAKALRKFIEYWRRKTRVS